MQKRTDFFDNSLSSIVPGIPLVIRNKPHNNQLCADLSRLISAYPVVSHFLRFAWQTTLVSSLGVTGTRSEINTDLKSIVDVIRQNSSVPCAIGFGISTPEQAKKMADIADGAIVGSAIIKIIEQYGKNAPRYVGEYVKSMKDAVR